jgi:hypothetical protein
MHDRGSVIVISIVAGQAASDAGGPEQLGSFLRQQSTSKNLMKFISLE